MMQVGDGEQYSQKQRVLCMDRKYKIAPRGTKKGFCKQAI